MGLHHSFRMFQILPCIKQDELKVYLLHKDKTNMKIQREMTVGWLKPTELERKIKKTRIKKKKIKTGIKIKLLRKAEMKE